MCIHDDLCTSGLIMNRSVVENIIIVSVVTGMYCVIAVFFYALSES